MTASCFSRFAFFSFLFIHIGMYVDGCAVFRAISPNLVPDECAMKNDDEGNSDEVRYRKVCEYL